MAHSLINVDDYCKKIKNFGENAWMEFCGLFLRGNNVEVQHHTALSTENTELDCSHPVQAADMYNPSKDVVAEVKDINRDVNVTSVDQGRDQSNPSENVRRKVKDLDHKTNVAASKDQRLKINAHWKPSHLGLWAFVLFASVVATRITDAERYGVTDTRSNCDPFHLVDSAELVKVLAEYSGKFVPVYKSFSDTAALFSNITGSENLYYTYLFHIKWNNGKTDQFPLTFNHGSRAPSADDLFEATHDSVVEWSYKNQTQFCALISPKNTSWLIYHLRRPADQSETIIIDDISMIRMAPDPKNLASRKTYSAWVLISCIVGFMLLHWGYAA